MVEGSFSATGDFLKKFENRKNNVHVEMDDCVRVLSENRCRRADV